MSNSTTHQIPCAPPHVKVTQVPAGVVYGVIVGFLLLIYAVSFFSKV